MQIRTVSRAARTYEVSHQAIHNWLNAGYINRQFPDSGVILVDLDEIDRARAKGLILNGR